MNTRTAELAVRMLGYPEVRWANNVLRFPTQKSLALLCYLAVRREAVRRDELAELLWFPAATANLRPELHRLRHLPGGSEWLEVGATVAVKADTDLAAFERAVQGERYEEALALYPVSEVLLRNLEPKDAPAFADWLEVERQRSSSLLRDALRGRSLELEQAGAFAEALTLLRKLIDLDPLDESAYRAAMRCAYQRGQVEAALSYFEACRRMLKKELEVEPLNDTLDLAREIERGQALPHPHAAPPKRRIPKGLLRPPQLVGREREWARLEAAWELGQSINLSGPPGIGKTRLMMDFVRSKGDYFIMEGRPGDRVVPYSSLARALREVLGRFPEWGAAAEPWVKNEVARILPDVFPKTLLAAVSNQRSTEALLPEGETRFFEAVVYLLGLLRERVGAIVVDDLQYLDARSFEAGMGAQARLLTERADPRYARLVAAFRTGELPIAFEQGLSMAVDYGLADHITVEPLNETAIKTMLQSLDMSHIETLAPRLRKLTGGNPQFIVETLKRLYEMGDIKNAIAKGTLPDKVVYVIKKRLDVLSQLALRLGQTLALLDQPAKPELLAQVLDSSALDVTEALAELEEAQVLKDGAFVHDFLSDAVSRMTPSATRTLLHHRIAEALEQSSADPVRIAHHWQQANEAKRATAHQLAAVRQYQAVGLYDDAIALLAEVLARGQDAATQQEARVSLVASQLELARYREAREVLAPLLDEALSPLLEARVHELMALVHLGEGQLHEAASLAAKGLEKGEAVGDRPLKQRLLLLQARVHHRLEQHQEALDLLEPLLAELRRASPSLSLAVVTSEVGALYDNLGRAGEALPLHYQALELAHQLGALHQQVVAAGHLVYCLLELGREPEALEPGEAALALGQYRSSDLLRINLARAYLKLERFEEAERHYRLLCDRRTDPALQAAAWARLAEVWQRSGRAAEVEAALERAIAGLSATDYARTHACVAIAVLRYGTEAQHEQLRPFLAMLELEALPAYQKADLQKLVERS